MMNGIHHRLDIARGWLPVLLLVAAAGCDTVDPGLPQPAAPAGPAAPAEGLPSYAPHAAGFELSPVHRMQRGAVVHRALEALRHEPAYTPQLLDLVTETQVFHRHLDNAYKRWRQLNGRPGEPPTLFEKVVAAADYVANLAKHPARHLLSTTQSDPRAVAVLGRPTQLLRLAEENQEWTGQAWVPAPGRTMQDALAFECTLQQLMLGGLVNTIGTQWMLVDVKGHTGFSYYDFELGKWVYIESTFNEHYRMASSHPQYYEPLSPQELHALSRTGSTDRVVAVRHPYQPEFVPTYRPFRPYVAQHPDGWSAMAVVLDGQTVPAWEPDATRWRVLPTGDGPDYFAAQIARGWVVDDNPEGLWAPQGEVFLDSFSASTGSITVQLSTNLAVAEPAFERSLDGGRTWLRCEPNNRVFPAARATVRYRAVGQQYRSGEVVILDLRESVTGPITYPAPRPK